MKMCITCAILFEKKGKTFIKLFPLKSRGENLPDFKLKQ